MRRKFKLALLSMHEAGTHGGRYERMLMNSLPDGTQIIAKSNDIDTGSIKMVLFNEEWEEVPLGEELEKVIVAIEEQEAPVSSIITLS